MERELPTFNIQGTVFIVDVAKTELREAAHPENTISFHDLQDQHTHYRGLYDQKMKNLAGSLDEDQSNNIAVDIPRMTTLDPVGMSSLYKVPLEGIESKTDFEVMVDQTLLKERQLGILPRIDIAGESFIVDWRLKELRSPDDITASIDLRRIDISDDGHFYQCLYNIETRSVVQVNDNTTAVPSTVVMLKIPNELRLDPVAVSREYLNNDTELLKKFPLIADLKATVVPIAETGLNEYMANNKRRIEQQQQQEEHKPSKKRHGRKL